jgi:sugar phosphate isomerase/epimerase
MQCGLQEGIELLAAHNVFKTALWHDKVAAESLRLCKSVLRDAGVDAISFCYLSLLDDVDAKSGSYDYERKIEIAAELNVGTLVTITGGMADRFSDISEMRMRCADALTYAAETAWKYGVRLALEPLNPMAFGCRSVISRLNEAVQIIESAGNDESIGLVFDTYNLWCDGGWREAVSRNCGRISNLHIADWKPGPKSIRLDRELPGKGVLDLMEMLDMIKSAYIPKALEFEVLSINYWKTDPSEIINVIKEFFSDYCGRADRVTALD